MEAVNSSEASLKFFQAAVLHPGLKWIEIDTHEFLSHFFQFRQPAPKSTT
jgi:hypothetical protein